MDLVYWVGRAQLVFLQLRLLTVETFNFPSEAWTRFPLEVKEQLWGALGRPVANWRGVALVLKLTQRCKEMVLLTLLGCTL